MTELPEPVTFDLDNPPDKLPELPEGLRWELTITAEADVLHPDGSVN